MKPIRLPLRRPPLMPLPASRSSDGISRSRSLGRSLGQRSFQSDERVRHRVLWFAGGVRMARDLSAKIRRRAGSYGHADGCGQELDPHIRSRRGARCAASIVAPRQVGRVCSVGSWLISTLPAQLTARMPTIHADQASAVAFVNPRTHGERQGGSRAPRGSTPASAQHRAGSARCRHQGLRRSSRPTRHTSESVHGHRH